MNSDIKSDAINLSITDRCCTGTTGCTFDGTLRNVKSEPIFIQKVYDAILVNLQALSTVNNQVFTPNLGTNARIIQVLNIRCRKFFNPENIFDPRNLVVTPETTLSGGSFVKDGKGNPVEVIGPDGTASEKIIFVDTTECDAEGKGTPVFGTQRIRITGNVIVEIDVVVLAANNRRRTVTLVSNVPIATVQNPIILTNFFELCVPSVFNSAFLPRFAEFCNITCETRLATNNIMRDIRVNPETGQVKVDLLIALCVSCEKKIIVPVQLCVLSTGFPELSPVVSPICTTFPTLFPKQIADDSINPDPPCPRPRPRLSIDPSELIDNEFDGNYETYE